MSPCKNLKVLHFYKTYYPDTFGGTEHVIFQIVGGTKDLGITSEVLSLSKKIDERTIIVNGQRAHLAKLDFDIASTYFSVSVFWRFYQLAQKADIIHYHFPWPFMDVVHFATRVKKPAIISYHSDIIRQRFLLSIYRPLMKRFLSSVDKIVLASPNYLSTSEELKPYRDKTVVISYGLDKSTYPQPSADKLSEWSDRFGGKPFFLFVGVMRYYKGLHILLDALRQREYLTVLIGTGPVEAELKKQAKKLELKQIHFLGFLPDEDKVALIKLCRAIVFPSHLRSEAFGISLLEGSMYGKPMISSEIGTGTSYVNINNVTGLVVPPSDPGALSAAMSYLWNNPDVAQEMGKRAEERYWQLFTGDKMASAYADLYRTICP